MRTILKNTVNLGDIEITDGIVTSLGETRTECDEEIDGTDALAWPGLIDSHVHFRTPGQEYKEDWISGSAAALAGGITAVVDMPNNTPPTTTYERLLAKRTLIDSVTQIQYRLAVGVTDTTVDELVKAQAGADVIKLDLGATTGHVATTQSENIERVFAETTQLIMIHAENYSTILANEQRYREKNAPTVHSTVQTAIHSVIHSREAAIVAVQQVLKLAKQYQREIYICHVSTQEEIELITQARAEGVTVHLEVTPHHLFLNTEAYATHGNFVKVNPPLREPADNEALWQAIRDGIVTTIASDHAPHTRAEKNQKYWDAPAGIPGIEFMFPLLLTAVNEGKLSLDDIERCCRTNPTQLFRFKPKAIMVGQPADLVLFNPTEPLVVKRQQIKSKCGWSPYLGMRMIGKVIRTILMNQL